MNGCHGIARRSCGNRLQKLAIRVTLVDMTMTTGLDGDRLLPADPRTREIARELYAAVADAPILSPHGHVDPRMLADDQPFADPTELFVAHDHYVTRLLVASGASFAELGLDPNSESPDDLAKAEELLAKIRPHLRYFHSSQYIEDLANGETCLAMGYSGDILQSADRATEAGQGVEIQYVIPKEGAVIWFDMLAIPADAPHPENAHAFINFIMEPQIAADISNYVLYANANAASMPMVDDDVKNNPSVYPPEEVKKNLFPMLARSAKYDRLLKRSWTRLKAGQ